MLRIRLFGPVQASQSGVALPMPDRHDVIRLLAYLLLYRDRPLARKTVAFVLWPDGSESSARAQLSRTLYRLQHEFLPPAAGRGDGPWLKASTSELQWSGDRPSWLDIQEFQERCDRGMGVGDGHALRSAVEDLERARRLYRGELLQDYADEWIEAERKAFASRYERLLERLAQLYVLDDQADRAVDVCRQLLARDPLRESAYRIAMYAHMVKGERSAALRQFVECEAVLRRELDVLPEPATAELARSIRAGDALETLTDLVFDPRLTVRGGPAGDPPRSAPADRERLGSFGRVPETPTRFVGRADTVQAIEQQVHDQRLVTLTGPGGCGKTRLAIEVARRCRASMDAVCWVDLASVAGADDAVHTVASAVDAASSGAAVSAASIAARLAKSRALLVLDNCEHVLNACAALSARLLAACPELRLLVTSRERLNLSAEVVWPVAPLTLPQWDAGAWQSPASAESVDLFVDRLTRRDPQRVLSADDLQTVAKICARTDGLPLAIELAAGQAVYLSLAETAALLDRGLDALAGTERDTPSRHSTLRRTIDWSHRQLTPSERALFRRLSIFAGGATWQAIDTVCRPAADRGDAPAAPDARFDVLRSLIDKSLVLTERVPGLPTRYRMLDLVRRYAAEHLEASGEGASIAARHARHFADVADALGARLRGADSASALAEWDVEHPNCLAALRAAQSIGDVLVALRLTVALWPYWASRGFIAEGRRHVEQSLGLDGGEAHVGVYAQALNGAGSLAFLLGDYPAARRYYEACLDFERRIGDPRRLATVLTNLSLVLRRQSEFDAARALCEESLVLQRAIGDPGAIAATLSALGNVCFRQGRFAEAGGFFHESLRLRREQGDAADVSAALHNVGLAFAAQGRYADACHYVEQSVAISRDLADESGLAPSQNLLGGVLYRLDRVDEARAASLAGLNLYHRLADPSGVADALHVLGRIALDGRQPPDEARRTVEESLRIRARLGERHGVAQALRLYAMHLVAAEELERAAYLLGVEQQLRAIIGAGLPAGERQDLRTCVYSLKRLLGPSRYEALFELGLRASGLAWDEAAVETLLTVDAVAELRRWRQGRSGAKPEIVVSGLALSR